VQVKENIMRKIAAFLAIGALAVVPSTAFADPDFGPGNSSKGPNDGGAKCHDPAHGTDLGSNDAEPGCKG
jgi:hypothetical protein